MMKLENGASVEAVHMRVPLCGQWHGRRTTCVSSLAPISIGQFGARTGEQGTYLGLAG